MRYDLVNLQLRSTIKDDISRARRGKKEAEERREAGGESGRGREGERVDGDK